MSASVVGSMFLAVPALVAAWLFLWRRQRPIFWCAAAMILVGTGYLAATGAAGDVGRKVAPQLIKT